MLLSEISTNSANPRLIKDDKFKKLVQSIKDFPAMMDLRPIIINESGTVLGGNMRLQALKEAGYTEVPEGWIKRASSLTADEERQFIIKDNVGFGEWDWETLANEWDKDDLENWGLDLPVDFNNQDASEDDYQMPDEIETDIVLGDLFEIGEHRLLCGDSTDSDSVAKLMNGEKADMVFTDPPYNIAYEGGSKKREMIKNDEVEDFYGFLLQVYSSYALSMKLGASIYVCHADIERVNFTQAFKDAGFYLSSVVIWAKNNATFGRQDYFWKHEPILYGWREGAGHTWHGDNKQDTIWNVNRPSKSESHPTMKPIELIEKALFNSSKQEDLILDLFLGSGSTLIASEKTGRICYGMELDPKYVDVIVQRYVDYTGNENIKLNGNDIVWEKTPQNQK